MTFEMYKYHFHLVHAFCDIFLIRLGIGLGLMHL